MAEKRYTLPLREDRRDEGSDDMTTKEGRSSFVWNTWIAIAPWGYGAYIQVGRGAVVIESSKDGPKFPKYLLLDDIGPERPKELRAMIESYDPDTDIVVLFDLEFSETGQFIAYGTFGVESDEQTPRALWKEAKRADTHRERPGVIHRSGESEP
jgi:hypothetical protein